MLNKKILIGSLIALACSSAIACNSDAINHFGVGGQIGMYTPINDVNSIYVNNKHFNGRIYIDYNFTKNFSLQTGYSYYSKYVWKSGFKNVDGNRLEGFDLVGVAKAPLILGFDLYAKAGANYIFTPAQYKKLTGLAGVGFAYNITENLAANIEAVRSFKHQKLPNIDVYSVGINYSFNI